jgi:hypothetical protein
MTAMNLQTEQNTLLVLRHAKGALPFHAFSEKGGEDLVAFAQWFEAVAGGVQNGSVEILIHRGSTAATPKPAATLVTFATSSGATGAVINGVTITVTWATNDITSMTALMVAILASSNALVAGLVGCNNLCATIALVSAVAGNFVEIIPTGGTPIRFTAVAAASPNPNEFLVGVSDTADATALQAKITAHPSLAGRVLCTDATGTVSIRPYQTSTTAPYKLAKSGTPITITQMVATASGLLYSLHKTKLANAITTAASGTNVSASGARMAGGVGGDSAPHIIRR